MLELWILLLCMFGLLVVCWIVTLGVLFYVVLTNKDLAAMNNNMFQIAKEAAGLLLPEDEIHDTVDSQSISEVNARMLSL